MFFLACRRAFHQAFRLWSEASSFTFQEVSANSPSDITIKFTVGAHGDGYSFDGPGNEQDIYVYMQARSNHTNTILNVQA